MSEEGVAYDTRPPVVSPDSKLLALREGRRGLLPSTWRDRLLKVRYEDAGGKAQDTTGTFLDHTGLGPVLMIEGARAVIPWERLVLVELDGN